VGHLNGFFAPRGLEGICTSQYSKVQMPGGFAQREDVEASI